MSLLDKATIITTPTAHSNGKLHSIKGGSVADFDVVRGSAATRVNAEGLIEDISVLSGELMTNGSFDTDSNWVKDGGWTIQGGEAVCNGVGVNSLQQGGITTIGKTYKLTFNIIAKSSDNFLVISTNFGDTYINGSSTSIGVNTFYITPTGGTGIRFRVADGTTLSIDNVSVKEVIDATNIPRIDYTTGEGVILTEPQSTNLVTYSEDFSQWGTIGSPTLTSSYGVSPDGTQNSTRIEFNTNDRIFINASASGDITLSVYLKGVGQVRLRDNDSSNTKDITLTSEWIRYEFIFNDTISNVQLQQATGTSDFEIWGAQVEALPYSTSYIPTSGAIATRLADKVTGAGDATTINSTEGVLYAEIAALSDDSTTKEISINNGSIFNRVSIYYTASVIYAKWQGASGGIDLFYITSGATDFHKVAIKYKSEDTALWVNGVEVGTSSSVNSASGLNVLDFDRADGVNNFYGKTKTVAVFSEALTDEELTCLTTI